MIVRAALPAAFALSVFAASLAAEAQPPAKVYRISLFHVGLDHVPPSLDGLRDGLKALGYEEGKNLRLDFRNLPDEAAARVTAAEFARTRPDRPRNDHGHPRRLPSRLGSRRGRRREKPGPSRR